MDDDLALSKEIAARTLEYKAYKYVTVCAVIFLSFGLHTGISVCGCGCGYNQPTYFF